MRFENTLGTTKLRWNRATSGSPEEQEQDAVEAEKHPQTEKQIQAQEIVENFTREVFNPVTNTADFRKVRVTDMKANPRVCLPKARPPEEERVLDAKEVIRESIFQDFMKTNSNDKGVQNCSNLSKQQVRGKMKLEARTKSGELVIAQTDKSGKNAIIEREVYKKMGDPHVEKDEEVTWHEYEQAKHIINCHNKALGNMFNFGQNWGKTGETRVRNAINSIISIVPQMTATPKDHKPLPESGIPKSRPLCNASQTMIGRISEATSDILAYMLAADGDSAEAMST